jgi:uncharacterized membrane protein
VKEIDKIIKINVHCHVWKTAVKEMYTVTSGEYQEQNLHCYNAENTSERNVHCHSPVLFINRFHTLIHSVNITYMTYNKMFDV